MYNCRSNSSSCSCPHCKEELKNGCMSPKFCKLCETKKHVRVCAVCGAEYALEYEKCPSCSISE
jgi:hypothetical protein